MRAITLRQPNKIVFANGALKQFFRDYAVLGKKKLFILTIPQLSDILNSAVESLPGNQGISYLIDTSIQGEPSFADFSQVLNKVREFNADSILGVGGGSVLDVSKLVAVLLKNEQSLKDIIGINKLKERKTYVACIPTTSGTGSEVSPNAIFIDDNGAKKGIISPFLVPDAAYIDPSLTQTVPAMITAATGMDALTHCLEAYANKFAHPMIDVIALDGIRRIAKYLPAACMNGDDLEARTQVALGSLYGGMCLGPINTGAVHALSYPLGTMFKIPHGLSNAVLLPYVMEYNLPNAKLQYSRIAEVIGVRAGNDELETAKRGIKAIKQLNRICGIPEKLTELEIPVGSIDNMAKDALKIQRLLKNNPREVSLEDAKDIYKSAM